MLGLYNTPDQRNLLDQTRQGIIGKPLNRPEGPLKVTGAAPYSAEYQIPDCVEGVLVTATIAQGKMTAIHREAVMDLPGVLGVFSEKAMLRRPAQGTAGQAPARSAADRLYRPAGGAGRGRDLRAGHPRRKAAARRIRGKRRHAPGPARGGVRAGAKAHRPG
nr:hypothetical protein [Paracoccus mutanolyticus]